jgi:hypothetical protein
MPYHLETLWNVTISYWNVTISYSLLRRGHPDIPMTYIPITYIPMTKSSMCRYSYKKSVEISNHFNDNRLQQNNTPLLQQPIASMCRYFNNPKLLHVDTSTGLSSYVSIFLQAKAPIVDIPIQQISYVSIFLQRFPIFQQTKAAMLRYFNFIFCFVGILKHRSFRV